jgi:hypothetical protein
LLKAVAAITSAAFAACTSIFGCKKEQLQRCSAVCIEFLMLLQRAVTCCSHRTSIPNGIEVALLQSAQREHIVEPLVWQHVVRLNDCKPPALRFSSI